MREHSRAARQSGGQLSVELLFLAAIIITLVGGFVSLAASFLNLSVRGQNNEQALEVAEAGVQYYKWHLAYAPQDYTDGTGGPGPYVHTYYNKSGVAIGQFTLAITPAASSSKTVTVQSKGTVFADSSISKIIVAKLFPSNLLQYNIVQNADLQIGTGTTIYGPIMANGGIHFDGFAYNVVQSAQSTFNDPSENGNQTYWAVHTDVPPADPNPPTPLPLRPDVFAAGRQLSVPAIDFTALTSVLAQIQSQAQNGGGVYEPSSGAYGYDLAFSTSTGTTTYTLYKVTSLAALPNGCTDTKHVSGWGVWSVGAETPVASGTIPVNGTFFVSDNVWVRGQIKGVHVVVGSAVFPDNSATWTSASINNDLRYTNYDGSDSMVVVAQNNVNVGLFSNDTLRIDGALVAEHGRVGRFYYSPPNQNNNSQKCGPYSTRTQITIYGTIITNQSYQFGFDDGTGYQNRQILYDINLYYNPPAILPTLSTTNVVSWEEIQ